MKDQYRASGRPDGNALTGNQEEALALSFSLKRSQMFPAAQGFCSLQRLRSDSKRSPSDEEAFQERVSLQLRVLGIGLLQDRDVGIGIFPERKKIPVRTLCFGGFAC